MWDEAPADPPPPLTYTQRLSRAGWLPPRARASLTRTIARRNALDRALAEARALDPADPRCARFQGAGACEALDREARRLAKAFVVGQTTLRRPS